MQNSKPIASNETTGDSGAGTSEKLIESRMNEFSDVWTPGGTVAFKSGAALNESVAVVPA